MALVVTGRLNKQIAGDSLDFQQELAAANIRLPVIFITGHGDIPMSVRAMKGGALDFLTKPFHDQDLLDAINVSLSSRSSATRPEARFPSGDLRHLTDSVRRGYDGSKCRISPQETAPRVSGPIMTAKNEFPQLSLGLQSSMREDKP
jgi:DNA-binding response OmpR family regulator